MGIPRLWLVVLVAFALLAAVFRNIPVALVILGIVVLLIIVGTARGADRYPLHVGSSGPRVCNLQWLLGAHKPNIFWNKLPATYHGKATCYFGAGTRRAVIEYKATLGYPKYAVTSDVGPYFIGFLLGKVRWRWPPGTLNPIAIAGPVMPHGVTLHHGSHGPRVSALQWLLGGHKPNVFTFTPYFKTKPNGWFGERTAKAILKTKWRLGYPARAIQPTAGREFELILTGHRKRPLLWVARAAIRLQAYITAHTPCADRLIKKATAYLGWHEIPYGSNGGWQVHQFQSVTGAYNQAWCASYVQAMLRWSGYGTIAHNSAYVPYLRQYAAYHDWLHAIARPGALVAFYYDYHHIGIVTQITTTGYWAISGNYRNEVARVFYRYGSIANAFIWLPGCGS